MQKKFRNTNDEHILVFQFDEELPEIFNVEYRPQFWTCTKLFDRAYHVNFGDGPGQRA